MSDAKHPVGLGGGTLRSGDTSGPGRTRCAAGLEELRRANPATADAQDCGALLVAAGDVLRRSGWLGSPAVALEIEAVLRALPATSCAAWAATVDEAACGKALGRALDAALGVALADEGDDRGPDERVAIAGLVARDRLESAVHALRLTAASALAEPLAARLAAVDAPMVSRARSLVGVNETRRRERDLLDPACREAAWWFSRRADCDGLVGLLAGRVEMSAAPSPHVAACADCERDLADSRMVDEPADRHATRDELFRHDLGLGTIAERRRIQHHADRCPRCAQAIWAYQDAERAVTDALSSTAEPAAESADGWELVAEGEGVRVLLRRAARIAIQVLLEDPRNADASVTIPARQTTVTPQRTAAGLEFDLGPADSLAGQKAHVTVGVSSRPTLSVELPLSIDPRGR